MKITRTETADDRLVKILELPNPIWQHCKHCGEPFYIKSKVHKYCSRLCKIQATTARRYKRKHLKPSHSRYG